MAASVRISRSDDGIWIIAPPGAPTVLDGAPGIEVMVLEVLSGHLTWDVLAGQPIPAAVFDDLALAQEWLWAVYGERVALAVADGEVSGATAELTAEPELPALVANAWRLAYAHWAARWWPASIIDGIAALDERLLDQEIASLRQECDLIVEGDDVAVPIEDLVESSGRAEDYALAAGTAPGAPAGALILAQGTGGWDWRGSPPGLLDASERAVSWQLSRDSGRSTVGVSVIAAPSGTADIPTHLHPRAVIRTPSGSVETELHLLGDTWSGEMTTSAESVTAVDVYVPGVGTLVDGDAHTRQRIRDFAAARLHRAAGHDNDAFDKPLLAEIAATALDSDF